jgi:hypothetical protein
MTTAVEAMAESPIMKLIADYPRYSGTPLITEYPETSPVSRGTPLITEYPSEYP